MTDYLAGHVTLGEAQCKCGCGAGSTVEEFEPELLSGYELLREIRGGLSLPIVSAARCKMHNERSGGVEHSAHRGDRREGDKVSAFDIGIRGGRERLSIVTGWNLVHLVQEGIMDTETAKRAYRLLMARRYGLGIARAFVHIDRDMSGILPRPMCWRYS